MKWRREVKYDGVCMREKCRSAEYKRQLVIPRRNTIEFGSRGRGDIMVWVKWRREVKYNGV